ncbi:DUF1330 domain-containing protein [Rhodococcus sp. NPDC056743]|uniref:DUF1330 domain-containing protein n=1 Tax=Rhodococcus sp. NPDC056743 TaxID=3345934 RepID=UPI00366E876D
MSESYVVGVLNDVVMGDDITEYLQRIDSTLAPFEGHFIIHGGSPDIREGQWTGDLIILRFPTSDAARHWYNSDAYQAIAPLRINNSLGTVAIFEGVDRQHRATDILN